MPVMAGHPGQPVPAGGPTRLSLMTGWQARRVGDVGRWLVTGAGFLLVGWGLRDVFHTLWHPGGRGGLARPLMRVTWRTGRRARCRPWLGPLTGPLAMLVAVSVWLLMIVLGWALAYWPHMPDGFVYGSEIDPGERGAFLDAVYMSVVSLATLGFGDIVPEDEWLRLVVPLQALVGFALISAAVSWVLQVSPALSRRRALAVRLSLLRGTGTVSRLGDGDTSPLPLLEGLTRDLVQARVDLTQFTETYYFRDGDPATSLPAALPVAVEVAEAAERSTRPEVCLAGELLMAAVRDFCRVVDGEFLRTGGALPDVVRAYADDHGLPSDPVR